LYRYSKKARCFPVIGASETKPAQYPNIAGRRLVIVSNRLPFNIGVEDGQIIFHPSAGGLVTGLASVRESRKQIGVLPPDHLWVGWPGASVEVGLRGRLIREALEKFQSYPVFLSEEQMEQFYLGFCNATIWPLFHYFPSYAMYHPACWEQYKQINQLFADALNAVLRPDDVVWVHDYHLMLLPQLLKTRQPQLSVGFFLLAAGCVAPRDSRRAVGSGRDRISHPRVYPSFPAIGAAYLGLRAANEPGDDAD
jgi:trehalose-6-phosphate synthase